MYYEQILAKIDERRALLNSSRVIALFLSDSTQREPDALIDVAIAVLGDNDIYIVAEEGYPVPANLQKCAAKILRCHDSRDVESVVDEIAASLKEHRS